MEDSKIIALFFERSEQAIDDFVAALNEGGFMLMDDIPLPEEETDIYDALEICRLYFQMKDDMTVVLRCFEGGYVQYTGIGDVCLKIDRKLFDSICKP